MQKHHACIIYIFQNSAKVFLKKKLEITASLISYIIRSESENAVFQGSDSWDHLHS